MVKNCIKKYSNDRLSWGYNVKKTIDIMSQITFTEFLSSFCIILSQINLNQNLNRASTSG